jgi:hypothetical protein
MKYSLGAWPCRPCVHVDALVVCEARSPSLSRTHPLTITHPLSRPLSVAPLRLTARHSRVAVYHFVPKARRYARAHIMLQVVSLVCWGASLSVQMPYRLAFWYPSLALDVAISFILSRKSRVRAMPIIRSGQGGRPTDRGYGWTGDPGAVLGVAFAGALWSVYHHCARRACHQPVGRRQRHFPSQSNDMVRPAR